jgi:hypothetical protein
MMNFHYETELCLGRRGRVRRRYRGLQALLRIGIDLVLGLIFSAIGLALWLVQCAVVIAFSVAIALVNLPLKLARLIPAPRFNRPAVKPAWAFFDEV